MGPFLLNPRQFLKHGQPPLVDLEAPMQFQAVTLGYDEFLGRLVIGRVIRGRLARGVPVVRIPEHGKPESLWLRIG